jgi:hypothetical protein
MPLLLALLPLGPQALVSIPELPMGLSGQAGGVESLGEDGAPLLEVRRVESVGEFDEDGFEVRDVLALPRCLARLPLGPARLVAVPETLSVVAIEAAGLLETRFERPGPFAEVGLIKRRLDGVKQVYS